MASDALFARGAANLNEQFEAGTSGSEDDTGSSGHTRPPRVRSQTLLSSVAMDSCFPVRLDPGQPRDQLVRGRARRQRDAHTAQRGFLLAAVCAATLCWGASATALKCYRYGPTYHKSEGGKVQIDPATEYAACGQAALSDGSATPCLDTCAAGVTHCYNYYRPTGFGSTAGGAYTEGGGSANYGMSQGGCFAGPVDAKWTGTTCVSNLDTTAAYKDGVPTDDIRQNCCTVDKCNDRPNPAARTRVSAVTAGTAVLAACVWMRSLCAPL